jgi:DNA-binding beta-propeller fold protein YncE
MIRRPILVASLALASVAGISAVGWFVFAPRKTIGEQPDGSFLVTTNQRLTPIGRIQRIEPARPKDLALSPDGSLVAVLATNSVVLFKANGDPVANVKNNSGPLGIAWAPDGATIYAAQSDGNVLPVVNNGAAWVAGTKFKIAATKERNPQVAGLVVSRDGKTLYAALGMHNQVAVVDLPAGTTRSLIDVGVCPYHLALSPDGQTLAVANRGGAIGEPGDRTEPSAGTPVRVETKTDDPISGSINLIRTADGTRRDVQVGKQPSGMVFASDGQRLFVANGDSDSIAIVDPGAGSVLRTFSVTPKEDPWFGVLPTSLALTPDGKTMYAALGGLNAVAVIDMGGDMRVRGYLPTGWYPISIAERNGRLIVASSKGVGSRAGVPYVRTGAEQPDAPIEKPDPRLKGIGVHNSAGCVQFIDNASSLDLGKLSKLVAANNRWGKELPPRAGRKPIPVPERVGEPSVFKHVVYIIKENHTYDSTLGDMPQGNGAKELCMFPEPITPNQHKLARDFVLLDNTYTSGTNSADGHQWTSSSIANGYMEQNYSAYARSYPYDGGDPLAYSPRGFWWNRLAEARVSLRIYGEFVNNPKIVDTTGQNRTSFTEIWKDYKAGGNRYKITADTDQLTLKPYLHPTFIGFPSNVSDQWRADQFLAELTEWESNGNMPSFCMMLLPNDHTSGTTPGWPTPRASVADNDLATGRIVEAISKSRFWKETLILIIEDDSQLGVDHLDGHRTIAFCVSPYTKRKAVVSDMFNHTSFARTIGLVLGMPAMTRFDRAATPLTACFTGKADFTPFVSVPATVPLDEINPRAQKLKGEAKRLALECAELDWSDVDRAKAGVVARAVWSVQKPGVPFPKAAFHAIEDDDDE